MEVARGWVTKWLGVALATFGHPVAPPLFTSSWIRMQQRFLSHSNTVDETPSPHFSSLSCLPVYFRTEFDSTDYFESRHELPLFNFKPPMSQSAVPDPGDERKPLLHFIITVQYCYYGRNFILWLICFQIFLNELPIDMNWVVRILYCLRHYFLEFFLLLLLLLLCVWLFACYCPGFDF